MPFAVQRKIWSAVFRTTHGVGIEDLGVFISHEDTKGTKVFLGRYARFFIHRWTQIAQIFLGWGQGWPQVIATAQWLAKRREGQASA